MTTSPTLSSDGAGQNRLRADVLDMLLPRLQAGDLGITEAAVALMGACAVVLGLLSDRRVRESAAALLGDSLSDHADKRHRELMSGAFDDELARWRRS